MLCVSSLPFKQSAFSSSTLSGSPWLVHSFSCPAIPMQMQLPTKVLLHTCSGSAPPPPVHMDILLLLLLSTWTFCHRCAQLVGRSLYALLASPATRHQTQELATWGSSNKRYMMPASNKSRVYHILMATFVPGYDYMGSCDAISWDKTVDKLVVVG